MSSARLSRLFISPGHNFFGRHGMEACAHAAVETQEVECVSGRGIRGDRFFDYKPDYKGQITFFDLEVFRELLAALGLPADTCPSLVRRNAFVEGVDLNTLIGREFTVGGVRFLGTGECAPCYWMDTALAPGAEAFLKGRGGLRCKILDDGTLRIGDTLAKNTFAGLVLAGGRSTRMGEDKAFLTVDGETLVARQTRLLREAGCETVLISGRAGITYPTDATVIHDAPGAEGPVAGMLAALDALPGSATHLVTLPVDLPAMRAETLRALMTSCETGYGAFAETAGDAEPLVAVVPRELFPALREGVAAGELSPKKLHAAPAFAGRMRGVDPRPGGAGDDFLNWNRRGDWSPPEPTASGPPG